MERRGVRVVEGARLESVYTGNGIAGSNPALSAEPRSYRGFCISTGSELQYITNNFLLPVTLFGGSDYGPKKKKVATANRNIL